jgi:hypothetical protein
MSTSSRIGSQRHNAHTRHGGLNGGAPKRYGDSGRRSSPALARVPLMHGGVMVGDGPGVGLRMQARVRRAPIYQKDIGKNSTRWLTERDGSTAAR